ncbi:PrsW family intramembrane metalloprotease [bacterium]|nr:PrsW family intramembrane metalloprotease [bacterium]
MRAQLGILFTCLLILLTANFFPRALPEDLSKRADALSAFGLNSLAGDAYEALLRQDPTQGAWLIHLIDAQGLGEKELRRRYGANLYNLATRDATLFGLGYASLFTDQDPKQALSYFERVYNRQLKGLNLYSGMALAQSGQSKPALDFYRREIQLRGLMKQSVSLLGLQAFRSQNLPAARELLDSPETRAYVGKAVRDWVDLSDHHWLAYAWRGLQDGFSQPLPAVLAALLIALMWMVLLRRIDVFEPEPAWSIAWMFLLGCLSAQWLLTPIQLLINILDPRLDVIQKPQLISSDLTYAVLHVGIPEELVKILPVLVYALLSRQFNEPLDWLIYGSLSALGFSSMENISYFSRDPSEGMLARFILCVLGHMTYTCLICYSWTRSRHMRGHGLLASSLLTLLAFGLAAGLHGLYDFVPNHQKLLVGWLEAVIYGRMLANSLSHSPFFGEVTDKLARLRNEDLIECTALLLLLIPYLWCNFTTSTELANQWLASNTWNFFLMLTFFCTVGFITLARQRELWFSQPDEDDRRTVSQRHLQIFRSVLVLSGLDYILSHALRGVDLSPIFAALVLGLFWVYFRGAFGGVRTPLQWISARPSPPQLAAAGFVEESLPPRAGRLRALLTLAGGPALLAAILLAVATLMTEGRHTLDLAVAMFLCSAPLAWVRPEFSAAWRHPERPVWAWVFGNGRILLWSRLSDGQFITAASISPWRVRPRILRLHLFPQASLEQLLEQHLRVSGAQPLASLEEDLGSYVTAVQVAFLASPLRHTIRCFWMFLTQNQLYNQPFKHNGWRAQDPEPQQCPPESGGANPPLA